MAGDPDVVCGTEEALAQGQFPFRLYYVLNRGLLQLEWKHPEGRAHVSVL